MRLATVLLCHLVSASALGLLTDYTGVLGTPGCSRVDLPPRVLSGLSSPTYPARSFKTLSSLHARAPAQRTSPTMSTSKSPPRPSLHVRPLRNQQLLASYCSERLEVEPRPALVARLALLVRLGDRVCPAAARCREQQPPGEQRARWRRWQRLTVAGHVVLPRPRKPLRRLLLLRRYRTMSSNPVRRRPPRTSGRDSRRAAVATHPHARSPP